MAEYVHESILEQILVRLDVKNLVRFKCICKSWQSFISGSRFIKFHLKYSYNYDSNNNELGDRRIVMSNSHQYVSNDDNLYHLLGSCDGLVCIFSPTRSAEILVANPSTREVKKLPSPCYASIGSPLCWGFGYDSCTNAYKVIRGFVKSSGDKTCFQILSLKSNVWKFIEEINYTFITSVGILCNGALHWIMKDQNKKRVILSFDLSEDKFQEIPLPDDAGYTCDELDSLGIIRNRLCLYHKDSPDHTWMKWVMKNYNVKQSWELLPDLHRSDFDAIHVLKSPQYYFPHDSPICQYNNLVNKTWEFIGAPIYVQSLVSPHVNGQLKGDMLNSKRNAKLIN